MNANRDVIAEMLKEGGERMQTIDEILGIPERIDKIIAEKNKEIVEMENELADKDCIIEKLMAEIAALKAAK